MNRILLVEDDTALAAGIEYALTMEGFSVFHAGTLQKAREAARENVFDAVLLDVMLPDGSGYDFCRELRTNSAIPVIFLTACDEEVNIVLGLDIGGDDYITKPFRLKELVSRINAVMRRYEAKAADSGNVLISGDLQVNTLRGKVYKNGSEIFLTATEYRLLLCMLKNKGMVLCRDSILEELWDIGGEFVDDNTLSVYIKRLREKIEDVPSKPKYILTVRGMGYKWEADVKE